jgi:hypothetical protein
MPVRALRRGLAIAACLLGLAAFAPAAALAKVPQIKHLFIVVLENKTYDKTFGPNPGSRYLAETLPAQGAELRRYYGIAHLSLPNYIAMVSGQPPNMQTQSDCNFYNNMSPGSVGADGIAMGQGCVYPAGTVQTVANQLEGNGYLWKFYAEDMANSVASGQPATCRHPSINGQDGTQGAKATDQYATRHVGVLYFHSIIDFPTCNEHVVDLNQLPGDLRGSGTTPSYSFVVPDLCADGHDSTCPDGAPGGYAGMEKFLKDWIPRITRSDAYEDRGLVLIAFDEAGATLGEEDQSACCNEQPGPNTPSPGGLFPGPGGGRTGAVMLSPCIKPGTKSEKPYNHYSQLRWVEDNFGLAHLGYAGAAGLQPFGEDVLNRPSCGETVRLRVKPRRPRVGERTVFRFRARSPLRRCRKGATVRFGGHRAKTNRRGKARIARRFASPGVRVARVRAPGCGRDRARVRVRPAA